MTLASRLRMGAASLSFAHLAGLAPRAAKGKDDPPADKREGDNPDEEAIARKDGESDEDYEARKAADKKKREAVKKKEEEEAAKKSDEDDEDSDPDADDDEEEMRGKSHAARARRRERARCAAIFLSPIAAKNPALAANLAFATALPRKEALTVLENTPAPAASSIAARAAANPNGLGMPTPEAPRGEAAIEQSWAAAAKPYATKA